MPVFAYGEKPPPPKFVDGSKEGKDVVAAFRAAKPKSKLVFLWPFNSNGRPDPKRTSGLSKLASKGSENLGLKKEDAVDSFAMSESETAQLIATCTPKRQ